MRPPGSIPLAGMIGPKISTLHLSMTSYDTAYTKKRNIRSQRREGERGGRRVYEKWGRKRVGRLTEHTGKREESRSVSRDREIISRGVTSAKIISGDRARGDVCVSARASALFFFYFSISARARRPRRPGEKNSATQERANNRGSLSTERKTFDFCLNVFLRTRLNGTLRAS